jgi:signal transduction histidine kinase
VVEQASDLPAIPPGLLGGMWSVDLWLWKLNWSPEARAIHEAPRGFTPTLWDAINHIDLEDRAPLTARFFECINTSRPFEVDTGLTTSRGNRRRVRIIGFAQPGPDGRVTKVSGVIQQLPGAPRPASGEQTEHSNALQVQKELEALACAMPHELRAPLAAVHGFAKVLQESEAQFMTARGRTYLERILNATLRMDRLTQSLLALATLSSRPLRRELVDLSAAARQAVDILQAGDPLRKVAVHIEPDLCACGDPDLLPQVLANLIGNAWKFTAGRDQAVITVQRAQTEQQQDATAERMATYVVHDNGPGFDMQHAARLFTPFQRLHPPNAFEGSGVGLAIVRRIVERHGGRAWAEAVRGQGASFYFTAPGPVDSESGVHVSHVTGPVGRA